MNGSAVEKISEISTTPNLEGVHTGKIVEIDQKGAVFIDFPGNRIGPIQARITAAAADSITRRADESNVKVLIAFEENDIRRPVIIDMVRDRIEPSPPAPALDGNNLNDLKVDGETITFEAKKEIVLHCGRTGIKITKDGRIIIKGAYLLSRSTGVNKIKGGSVQIN